MRRALLAALLAALAPAALGQTTGTLTILPSGAAGSLTTVGACSADPCFQAEAALTFFAAPPGGGVATFRAITEADLPSSLATDLELTAAIAAHAAVAAAHHTWPLTAADVAYSPTTPGDWTDPDPTEAAGALDALAARPDADTFAGYTPTGADLGVVTGTAGGAGICAEWNVDGDLVAAASAAACGAGGSASPGGSGSELQYRAGASTFGAVTGSGVSGGAVGIGIATPNSPLHVFGDPGTFGQLNIDSRDAATQVNFALSQGGTRRWVIYTPGSGTDYRLFGVTTGTDAWTLTQAGTATVKGSAAGLAFLNRGGGTTWQWYSASNVARLYDGAGDRLTVSGTEVTLAAEQVNSPATQTCPDEGTGAAGALTVAVSGVSNVEVTQADANGCAASLSETGATRGAVLTVSNVSNAGGTLAFADSTGVQETGAGCSLALYGVAVFRYISDRWLLQSCIPSN